MTIHYVILDDQTGDYSLWTTVENIFESCVEDYMTNDWNDQEAEDLEREFAEMTEEEKRKWVVEVYEYSFHQPTPLLISRWEKCNGYKWEEWKDRNENLTDEDE